MQIFVVLQASDNAKEAEDNARKAKSAVKTVLNTITALLDQLGKNCLLHHAICQVMEHVQLSTNRGSADEVASLAQSISFVALRNCWVPPQETSTEWI